MSGTDCELGFDRLGGGAIGLFSIEISITSVFCASSENGENVESLIITLYCLPHLSELYCNETGGLPRTFSTLFKQ